MHYPHTFPPYDHQRRELEEFWDKHPHACFWEQGTGKMKSGYDWALTQWQAGHVDTMIVIAPSGVHRDWVEEGFKNPNPEDEYDQPLVPPTWWDQITAAYYDTGKARTKKHMARMSELLGSPKMVVLAMTYDAVRTAENKVWMGGRKFLEKILKSRRCALLLDEASAIQSPTSKITTILNGRGGRGGLAQYAVARRIYEGTPVDEGPFNAYSQMQFLDKEFWPRNGFNSYKAFSTYFGIFREGETHNGRKFQTCVAYRNLEELRDILRTASSRVLKADVLDLRPKIYQNLRFDLSPEQRRMYDQLEAELHLLIKEDGGDIESLVTAEIPITNVLRLYQITAGYIPFDEDQEREIYEFKENPRLEESLKHLNGLSEKTVVWCRFTRDVELISSALGTRARRYDGQTDPDTRHQNKLDFTRGDAQFIVAQIQAMAKGHTLNMAPNVLYYTNDSRLRLRRQSEDRTHRGRMSHSVTYTDVVANDTVDEKRIRMLRTKKLTADTIMGEAG